MKNGAYAACTYGLCACKQAHAQHTSGGMHLLCVHVHMCVCASALCVSPFLLLLHTHACTLKHRGWTARQITGVGLPGHDNVWQRVGTAQLPTLAHCTLHAWSPTPTAHRTTILPHLQPQQHCSRLAACLPHVQASTLLHLPSSLRAQHARPEPQLRPITRHALHAQAVHTHRHPPRRCGHIPAGVIPAVQLGLCAPQPCGWPGGEGQGRCHRCAPTHHAAPEEGGGCDACLRAGRHCLLWLACSHVHAHTVPKHIREHMVRMRQQARANTHLRAQHASVQAILHACSRKNLQDHHALVHHAPKHTQSRACPFAWLFKAFKGQVSRRCPRG